MSTRANQSVAPGRSEQVSYDDTTLKDELQGLTFLFQMFSPLSHPPPPAKDMDSWLWRSSHNFVCAPSLCTWQQERVFLHTPSSCT